MKKTKIFPEWECGLKSAAAKIDSREVMLPLKITHKAYTLILFSGELIVHKVVSAWISSHYKSTH